MTCWDPFCVTGYRKGKPSLKFLRKCSLFPFLARSALSTPWLKDTNAYDAKCRRFRHHSDGCTSNTAPYHQQPARIRQTHLRNRRCRIPKAYLIPDHGCRSERPPVPPSLHQGRPADLAAHIGLVGERSPETGRRYRGPLRTGRHEDCRLRLVHAEG